MSNGLHRGRYRHEHRDNRPQVRRPLGRRALVAGHRTAADRGAALLDRHGPGRRETARRTPGPPTDTADLRSLAGAWSDKYGDDWRFEVRDHEFLELSHSGGSTSGGAWVYRVDPTKVIAFGGAHGQTTYHL
jgi:hypothetical protein